MSPVSLKRRKWQQSDFISFYREVSLHGEPSKHHKTMAQLLHLPQGPGPVPRAFIALL